MSLQDPISDMLTIVRNGQMVHKEMVIVPHSQKKIAILEVLKSEGYIEDFQKEKGPKPNIHIFLKYFDHKPVIQMIRRVSKPGLRVYKTKDEIPTVLGGLGIAIVSTSKGVMSDKEAKKLGQGGEVLCLVA